ncbi:FUSC family protein [Rhodanobacter sp. C01]|uniref:FUSC family protein n=1 Tax=Rhodanobacter sp. C01 TaxID=1945856 RepID=UPI0009CF7759|nr:FUSC family protein [Rhodanobacter sp. C01]OOG50137.1 hypothetical protein B0E50_03105 [Rhodanobacter sp. C01]
MNPLARRKLQEWLDGGRRTMAAVSAELASMSWRGPRARESLKAALSVMLAVALAKALGLDDLWWAAFSGYMVMRSSFDETFRRGVYRIAGTVVGVALGVGLAPVMAHHPLWRIVWIFGFGAVTLYFALLSRYGYAWLFLGLTHVMVLAFAVPMPGTLLHFAKLRIADVAVGTAACVIVSALFALAGGTHPRSFLQSLRGLIGTPVAARVVRSEPGVRRRLLQHVCEAALALACVTALGYGFGLTSFTQASITVFAVMMLPITDFAANRRGAVRRKLIHRCFGCLSGGLAGILLLLLTGHVPLLWWLALALGVWVGQHLQNSGPGIGYIGTQFCLGYLTAFVHDPHLAESYAAAAERFAGILSGLLVLGVILYLGSLLSVPKEQDE